MKIVKKRSEWNKVKLVKMTVTYTTSFPFFVTVMVDSVVTLKSSGGTERPLRLVLL